MDRQHYVDLLLENENLTASLTDEPANLLLNWGVSQIDTLMDGVAETEVFEERFTSLIRFMRSINRLVGGLPEIYTEDIQSILSRYAQIFGQARTADESECTGMAAALASMEPVEALGMLLHWVEPPQTQ